MSTEYKNNIIYEIDCGKSETAYFGESKRSLNSWLDKQKRSAKNCNSKKNGIAKYCQEKDHNFDWDHENQRNYILS